MDALLRKELFINLGIARDPVWCSGGASTLGMADFAQRVVRLVSMMMDSLAPGSIHARQIAVGYLQLSANSH